MATINKRSPVAAAVFATATACYSHTESGYFAAEPCDIAVARTALYATRDASLRALGDGRYTVRVHSNEWYDLTAH